jgi:hypothetical protein
MPVMTRQGLFNLATRQTFQRQNNINFQDSSPVFATLPQSGLCGKIRLLFTGTTTTAAASSATRKTYLPAPVGIVRRVILRSSEGAELFNCTGYGAYLLSRTLRTNGEYFVNDGNSLIPGAATDPFTRYFSDGGDLGASASANWRFMLEIPVALGEQNVTGMILLQNPATQHQLEIQWGTTGDIYTTTGTVTLSNVTCVPELEFYQLPASVMDDPDLSFIHRILENSQSITATGDQQYNLPLGGIYLKLIHELSNGATAAPLDISKVNALKIIYAQSQVPYNMHPDIHLWRQRRRYGQDLPSAVYVHDFGIGNFLPEEPTSRDLFDTGEITDMQSIITLDSSLALAGSPFLRTIREEILPSV